MAKRTAFATRRLSVYVEFFFLLFNVFGLFRLRRYDTFFPESSLVVVFLSLVGLLGVCGFCFLVLPRFLGKLMFNVREATLTIRAWLDREPVATLGCEPIVILVLVCTAVNPRVFNLRFAFILVAHPELLGAIGAWMMHLFCCRVFTAVNPDVLSELQIGRTPFFCALGLSGVAHTHKQQKINK